MKYNIILTDNEVETILNLEYRNLGEAIDKLKKEFNDFDLSDTKKSQFILTNVLSVGGKLEYNPKDLRCPNCNGKYVVRTYAGDLYYRLIMGTEAQKEVERQRFAKMGLHSNPWACGEYLSRDYLCLNCGVRWDNKGSNIYRDIEELKEK